MTLDVAVPASLAKVGTTYLEMLLEKIENYIMKWLLYVFFLASEHPSEDHDWAWTLQL